ncbi:cytochrome P450 [Durotheca rogersii]|uniref:cytochrome P450 n=1 Tax=Durotheca rogersii TaxID=419775 RepID=UPI00221E3F42|nr:cytochrome P450 [Durotheca rogersii]KAI5861438.1 cytochrome P450 [Durotheca rogersii]
MLDPSAFLLRLKNDFGSEKPLLVKAGPLRFYVFADSEQVKTVFRNSKRMTNKSSTLFALHYLLGLPRSAVNFYQADDSGMSLTPRPGSKTRPENRINFLIAHNAKVYMSSSHLQTLDELYVAILLRRLDALDVGDEWVAFPDLHVFLQRIAMHSSIEALAGSKVLELCPQLVEDILVFQSYVPDFLHLRPRWLVPEAYRVRKRILDGFKKWEEHALKHSDCSQVGPEDAEWEPYWGTKLVRVRQQYTRNAKGMNADARATENLGFIFTSTTNITTSIFWFILEALKDPRLFEQLTGEVAQCRAGDGNRFNLSKLVTQPLLQSTYAEVLRLYVATAISRVAEYEDIHVAGYAIPKDSMIIMYSRTMALDSEAWIRAGRRLRKPLEEFDAERFLVSPDWMRPRANGTSGEKETTPETGKTASSSERRFSTEGLLGLWIPYGGGDHICPGRQFAKHQMLLTFAMLFDKFEIELALPDPGRVQPNMRYAPFGALPPAHDTPFRIRKRRVSERNAKTKKRG